MDKVSDSDLDDKLKGHSLLRQTSVDYCEKHIVISSVSSSYDVHHVSAALCNMYRSTSCPSATHVTSSTRLDTREAAHGQGLNCRSFNGSMMVKNWKKVSNIERKDY